MDKAEYDELALKADRDLYDFVTEKDSSQRKWVALHLLEQRRNKLLTDAAKSSACAAWLAAGVAGVSAIVAIMAYVYR
jgi:hypothetical protein